MAVIDIPRDILIEIYVVTMVFLVYMMISKYSRTNSNAVTHLCNFE